MVKHIILWKLKEDISTEGKRKVKENIKDALEALKGQIPGLIEIRVRTEGLLSSTADLMLDSLFEDEEALSGYGAHPAHVKAAETNVRPYTQVRLCMDFEVSQ